MTVPVNELEDHSSPEASESALPHGAPPRLPRAYLPRRALWNQLDRAAGSPVTVVVAPVGAGKTLGVAGWVRQHLGAGESPSPDGTAGAIWLDGSHSWGNHQLGRVIDAAAAGRATPRLVIIDDAHKLPAATVHGLEYRLDHDPQHLRVVLISRWDLLRTSLTSELMGDLTVIRGDVLRLDDQEAAALIRQHVGTDRQDVIEAVTRRAAGWCAAVVLASRAIGASQSPLQAADSFARGRTSYTDRVASEVFAALSQGERHLLLCLASERFVTGETARHLTGDPRAADLLDDLARTGLLVTRVSDARGDPLEGGAEDGKDAGRFRIHPLMIEVARRRRAAGGVDVERARSMITRAVRLDLARGEIDGAFDRLLAVGDHDQATQLLGRHGVTMIVRGETASVSRFLRYYPGLVAAEPAVWFPIAIERWIAGDVDGTRHWLTRLRQHGVADDPGVPRPICEMQLACAGVMLARLGLEPFRPTIAHAQALVTERAGDLDGDDVALRPLLLTELGATQTWYGDLDAAKANLTTAIGLARTRRLAAITADATSRLAANQLLTGEEHLAGGLASQALELLSQVPRDLGETTAGRSALIKLLARFGDLPWISEPPDHQIVRHALHPADLTSRFLARTCAARLRVYDGRLAAAEETIAQPLDLPVADADIPVQRRAGWIVERACLANLSGDAELLKALEADLRSLDLAAESALVAGFRADLAGNRQAAAEHFRVASDSASAPETRPTALVCAAQLWDVLGQRERALNLVGTAVTETASRRNALPFLGCCHHGTPAQTLIGILREQNDTPWLTELADATRGCPDLTARFAATTATPRERARAVTMPVRPELSTRERDVLRELARGSTYADIGAELFVSENTVKTHVSNLYAKLGASRRSEALTIARALHLL